jgi:seryl-tRNA synthetase
MIDIQFVRDNPELVTQKSKQKGYEVDIKRLLELDTETKTTSDNGGGAIDVPINEHTAGVKQQPPNDKQIAAGA